MVEAIYWLHLIAMDSEECIGNMSREIVGMLLEIS